MKLDFFNPKCQEAPKTDEIFGLCDDEDKPRAYSTLEKKETWIATVENKNKVSLTFTAIDKCVLNDDVQFTDRGRCDGMMTSEEHLYLVELKNVRRSWQTKAINQLESTMKFLHEYHRAEIRRFKFKKAFGSNKKKKNYEIPVSDNSRKTRILRQYDFLIVLNTEIHIEE